MGYKGARRAVTDRTILAPLAVVLVAAILTLPMATLIAGRDVERMADVRLSDMVGEMFSGYLDDFADNFARELLMRSEGDLLKATDSLVLDDQGNPLMGRDGGALPEEKGQASVLARRLAQSTSIDAYHSQLHWRDNKPFVAVAVRQPRTGRVLFGRKAIDTDHLRSNFAQRLHLTEFRLDRRQAIEQGRTIAPVVWQDKVDGSAISWKRENAGKALVDRLLPVVTGLMLLIAAGGGVLFWRARILARSVLKARAKAEYLALHDGLTGLANRGLFMQNLALALARRRRDQAVVGVCMVDLDRFKQVNDTLGHQAGDDLIVETARRLQATCRESDTVARFGGDEFAIVAMAQTTAGLHALAERLVKGLQGEVEVRGGAATLSGSVGMAIVGDEDLDSAELLRRADLALYDAKHGGRARYCLFSEA